MLAATTPVSLSTLPLLPLLFTTACLSAQGARNFGQGCAGSRATPAVAFAGSFAGGAGARALLSAGPASAPVLLLFGTSNKSSALGPLPFDLSRFPGFGPGCLLLTSSEFGVVTLTNAAGGAEAPFLVPNVPGASFYLQYASLDALSPLRFTMTDGLAVTIGRPGVRVAGRVRRGSAPVVDARVTIFDPSLSLFLETRSDRAGAYAFDGVPPGTWRHGVAALNLAYREAPVTLAGNVTLPDVVLVPETHPGRWQVIGNTLPHFFDATDMAVLLPNGRIWFCHDTKDPILFDPVTGKKEAPVLETREQGCFNSLLLESGDILVVGGQEGSQPGSFRRAVRWTKRLNFATKTYTQLMDLLNLRGRWYPGLARLADGRPLVLGGGQRPDASRTATCEIYDVKTGRWQWAASMQRPSEFSPSALLYTGDVLKTWSPPELYDPAKNSWRATGDFTQPSRGWPGHSDHSLVVLADGRAMAVGIRTESTRPVMGEIYDPRTGRWSLTANASLPRFQTEVVQLPDGRVLAAGGEAAIRPIPVPHKFGVVRYAEIYDPQTDRWRRVADLRYFREYHAVTQLIPDGRVVTTGGTVIKFRNKPVTADVEAFEPPYLFRGVRARITAISDEAVVRGTKLSLTVFPRARVTSVVLVGFGAHTHWLDSGVKRRLVLPVVQQGPCLTVQLPSDPNVLPVGHYMVFAMVDDVPSIAEVVRVL